jgi:long-chain acyl-CoA synthetase
MTWNEVDQIAERTAAGIVSRGIEAGARLGVSSNTRVEWILVDLGVLMAGCTTVPIYQSSTADDTAYIINDAELQGIFVEDDVQIKKLLEVRAEIPHLKYVIYFDTPAQDLIDEAGEWLVSWEDFQASGESYLTENAESVQERSAGVKPEDLLTLVYTSGTTGRPKGVMITHDNMVYEAEMVAETEIIKTQDVQLLFLPLAHIFAKVLEVTWFKLAHKMAFAESIANVVENMSEVKPHFMASVPRIFEKVYGKVKGGVEAAPGFKGKIARWLFKQEAAATQAELEGKQAGGIKWALAQKLAMGKVAAKLSNTFGGRLRFFISGGAPLPPDIAYFFKHAGVTILEGYGLTETSAATSVNLPDQCKIGTVGPVIKGTEVKIAEDGEIMIRGRGVFQGYWNRPEATAEALEPDGWFHSGDLGSFDGPFLKITGRKKDIIVTAGGKNIAPQNLESKLKSSCGLISQVVVHGDKRKFLSAIVTLDEQGLMEWAAGEGIEGSFSELTGHEKIHRIVEDTFNRVNGELARYETIKKYHILDQDFSIESGELTPSLKVKRNVVNANYQHIYDSFYED